MDIGTFLFSTTASASASATATATATTSVTAKTPSPWHRMKWSDDIVRLLIHLVSSVDDDAVSVSSSAAKKAKWKTVSQLMLDHGSCHVSPQQCEDKFNDLNKRYKRLNEILGRGTTCQVVENPSLLDSMSQIPEKSKVDVRKILSSKHLFYREMCAYHNGQRIPNSQELKVSDVSELEDEEEEEEEEEENGVVASLGIEIDGLSTEEDKREWLRKRGLKLLEERVEIEARGLELEERRGRWERFKRKKNWELDKARIENERFGLENERVLLELRNKEMELELRPW